MPLVTLQTAPVDWSHIINNYGIYGVILYLIFTQAVPRIWDVISEDRKAERAKQAEERQAELEQKKELASALRLFGEQMHTFGLALKVVTDRLTNIERDQDEITRNVAVLLDRKKREREMGG